MATPARVKTPDAPQNTPPPINRAAAFISVFKSASANAAASASASAGSALLPGMSAAVAPATLPPAVQSATLGVGVDGPAGPLFGPNPWLTDPTGQGPDGTTHYNPDYFATPQTAQTVANMVGGTVVAMNEFTNSPGSPYHQSQPNLMVQLPNGSVVNPGLIATLFTHNWPTSFINQQLTNEVRNALPPGATT